MDILEDLLNRVERLEAVNAEREKREKAAADALLPPARRKKPEPLPELEGVHCPNHPDAGVTVNGCTEIGCSYSPPQAPQEA